MDKTVNMDRGSFIISAYYFYQSFCISQLPSEKTVDSFLVGRILHVLDRAAYA